MSTSSVSAAHSSASGLSFISHPRLLSEGTDADPPALVAPFVAEQLPNGTLVRFDDLTHFGPFQDPPRIAASIAAALFLD